MTKKLKLSPQVSYFLGIYEYNRGAAVGIITARDSIAQRFIEIAVKELGVAPEKITVEKGEDEQVIHFYHSKLKKMLERALERRAMTFRYKNDYAASYLAGIFDAIGGRNAKGLYMEGLSSEDQQVMENLDLHTFPQGRKCYIMNERAFVSFVKGLSIRLADIVH